MSAFGGVLWKDPERLDAAATAAAMAARVPGAGEPALLAVGQLALFATGDGSVLHQTPEGILCGDLDLLGAEGSASPPGGPDVRGLATRLADEDLWRVLAGLRGGFSLAFWDAARHRLLLAVDHFGIKRLHWAETRDAVLFASRPDLLFGAGGLERRVDPTAIYLYLNFAFVPSPGSAFRSVRRLAPGHGVVVNGGRRLDKRYWELSYPETPWSISKAAAATFEHTEAAVRAALAGTDIKETGAFLSGGTDSSTVLGMMGRVTSERVNAFSIGFREARYDEMRYADLAARHFGASHHKAVVTADDALAILPSLVRAHDEPFGNASAIPAYFCCRLARDSGITRLLAGDGGDEIFGGNERYRTHQVFAAYHRVPRWLRRGAIEPMLSTLPQGRGSVLGKAQRYVRRANIPNPQRFYHYEFFAAREGASLLAPDFLAAVDTDAPWRLIHDLYAEADTASELHRLLYLDMRLTIGDNDLLKVSQSAELAGVGVRFPMLDRPLVEFTATLPAHHKVKGLEKRYLFRRAFRSFLPKETLAKKKHGFGLPVADWLKSHPPLRAMARDLLLARDARTRGHFRAGAIERLFTLHEHDTTSYYGDILWPFLMLELWYREHAGACARPVRGSAS
jgi:asparagine synthase (glutamine-hydrolysing)